MNFSAFSRKHLKLAAVNKFSSRRPFRSLQIPPPSRAPHPEHLTRSQHTHTPNSSPQDALLAMCEMHGAVTRQFLLAWSTVQNQA